MVMCEFILAAATEVDILMTDYVIHFAKFNHTIYQWGPLVSMYKWRSSHLSTDDNFDIM